MAVTCSFKKKLGHAWLYSREYKPVKCDIWAGGNCIMVITWGKSKQMQCFFSDMRHLRDYAKNCSLRWFWKIELSVALPYAKGIAETFAKNGVPATLLPEEKPSKPSKSLASES